MNSTISLPTVTKMLVVSGKPYSTAKKTELINLSTPNTNCVLPDFPIEVQGAVGFTSGQWPLVCGGQNGADDFISKECFALTGFNSNHEWESWSSMTVRRSYAVTINTAFDQTLIIGGKYHLTDSKCAAMESFESFKKCSLLVHTLKSIEVINSNESRVSVDLPFTLLGHCIAKINDSTALISGARQNGKLSSETWFLDLYSLRISNGPTLHHIRGGHGCATLNLRGRAYGIFSGGYYYPSTIDTTEFIDLQTWKSIEGNY